MSDKPLMLPVEEQDTFYEKPLSRSEKIKLFKKFIL